MSAKAQLLKSPNSSVSLRRKSALIQNTDLSENNDEEERQALRRELTTTIASRNVAVNDKRRSLGLGFLAQMSAPEMTNRICECIKLSTENKINIKNAFNLEMIDFMTYMIKKQDANMSTLMAASTSLDVSTKIYGYRVDGVHTELMKMVGGLEKQDNEASVDIQQDLDVEEGEAPNLGKQKKKKKSKSKQKIFCSADSLKGTIEIMKPSFWMMEEGDSQTTDALYQVMLPNHANSKFYLHFYNDVIVDSVEHETLNTKSVEMSIPKIEDFSELEICSPVDNFEFLGWTDNNEEEEEEEKKQPENDNENGFRFDLDASVPSEDEADHEQVNYFDVQDEANDEDEFIEPQRPVEKIVDLCKVVTTTEASKMSEYSFLQKNMSMHWAGPSHWKINNFNKFLGGSKIIETCHQGRTRKRKEIELSYSNDIKEAAIIKFLPTKAGRLEIKNAKLEWHEENILLPRDMHYNIASATKLYLHELFNIHLETDQLNTTHVFDSVENYNYNNENDVSNYCPNIPSDDYGTNDNDNEDLIFEDGEQEAHVMFGGDNLVAVPKLTNKISIAYSIRAKRIDMRQLKRSIWKGLVSKEDTENIDIQNLVQQEIENKMNESKCFSEVYKVLPNMLTKTNIEALSFPISFVSLLHLANEKTLKIESLPDMSDIIVATD
ncbi:condensin complex subunit 2 [Calliopsis andreniformis]|uniref:condensin complex subunit 2 n=1 Tax=Calliopsis andreniformis TaxID=337506 RepID=UPI003FCE1116